MERVIDINGAEHYIDLSLVIGFSQQFYSKKGDGTPVLLDEYDITVNSHMNYFLRINESEVLRLKALIESRNSELVEIKNNLTDLKDIDELLKSIRGN